MMRDIAFISSTEKSVRLKEYLPNNCEIALTSIMFKNHSFNVSKYEYIAFDLSIFEGESTIYMKTVQCPITPAYYKSFRMFLKEIIFHMEKRTRYFTEIHYYIDFITRWRENNGIFNIMTNDGDLKYSMTCKFGESLSYFLNIPQKVNVGSAGYNGEGHIRYDPELVLPLKCRQLKLDPNTDNRLRNIYIKLNYGILQGDFDYENLIWKQLNNFSYNLLEFDWPDRYQDLRYTVAIRQHYTSD